MTMKVGLVSDGQGTKRVRRSRGKLTKQFSFWSCPYAAESFDQELKQLRLFGSGTGEIAA